MRPRGDDDGTRGMRSGSGIDRIKGVSRVGKNPQPAWVVGPASFFFSHLCERVREVRKTDDESFVCVRDVLG